MSTTLTDLPLVFITQEDADALSAWNCCQDRPWAAARYDTGNALVLCRPCAAIWARTTGHPVEARVEVDDDLAGDLGTVEVTRFVPDAQVRRTVRKAHLDRTFVSSAPTELGGKTGYWVTTREPFTLPTMAECRAILAKYGE